MGNNKQIVLVEDRADRIESYVEAFKKDGLTIEKVFVFKNKSDYGENGEKCFSQGFLENNSVLLVRVDIWSCYEEFDSIYNNDEDTVFLMDWGLDGDGSEGIFERSASVLYARSKITADSTSDNVKDRFFLYTAYGPTIAEKLKEAFPGHAIDCDEGSTMKYRENTSFCRLFALEGQEK